MNSWRLSSVMWPTAVRKPIALCHSASVSFVSRANECRCWTRLVITVRNRSSRQPPSDAITACVMVSSLRLRIGGVS